MSPPPLVAGGRRFYGTDGSTLWYVAGPVIARLGEGTSNLPRGLYTIDGIYRIAFGPTGFKTITLTHGTIHDLCLPAASYSRATEPGRRDDAAAEADATSGGVARLPWIGGTGTFIAVPGGRRGVIAHYRRKAQYIGIPVIPDEWSSGMHPRIP